MTRARQSGYSPQSCSHSARRANGRCIDTFRKQAPQLNATVPLIVSQPIPLAPHLIHTQSSGNNSCFNCSSFSFASTAREKIRALTALHNLLHHRARPLFLPVEDRHERKRQMPHGVRASAPNDPLRTVLPSAAVADVSNATARSEPLSAAPASRPRTPSRLLWR